MKRTDMDVEAKVGNGMSSWLLSDNTRVALGLVKEYGVSRIDVVNDMLDIAREQIEKVGADKIFGPDTRIGKAKAAREAREAAQSLRKEQRADARFAKVAPVATLLADVSGVNGDSARSLALNYRTWSRLANADATEIVEVGSISKTAASAVRKLAAGKVEEEKEAKSALRTKVGAKRNEASKTLVKHSAEKAAEILGLTVRKVTKMAQSGKLMTTDNGASVRLPANIADLPEDKRLAAAEAVVA